jgi:hypothetical protein
MKRVREYWEVNNLHFFNLTETDINALGEFIAGVAVKDLEKLPRSVLQIAIKRLGEKLDLPEDKLRARAYLAIQFIKVAYKYFNLIDSDHVILVKTVFDFLPENMHKSLAKPEMAVMHLHLLLAKIYHNFFSLIYN